MSETAKRKRKKRGFKLKLAIALLVLIGVGSGIYFKFFRTQPVEKFAITKAAKGSVVDKLAETGTIQLVRTVEVKSTVAGEVRKLLVEAGDQVEEGQLLALIEPDPTQSLQLYQKRSAVDQARIRLKVSIQPAASRAPSSRLQPPNSSPATPAV